MIIKKRIKNLISQFVKEYPDKNNTETMWQEPLTAFADAKDELFYELKQYVSPTHALPVDLLPGAETVVTYFIPFDKTIAKSNIEGPEASRAWAKAYIETNKLILDLNTHMHNEIQALGYNSNIMPATHNFDVVKLISDWSHRHAAYVAGLGKFGLNNMLITEKGCCGRFGSFVTDAQIEADERKISENCLYKHKGICKKCVDRCVNDALKVGSFDRHKCYGMCLFNDKLHSDLSISDVCGKCLVNVPCSFVNPVKKA
ncbi:hypothetical protein OXPF_18840 [Oxobacter pfennigii]|uniref:Epoxyqueuosine reductase n=1 Tax=Oxobacter pfennigii TaxID=36849 RepID=A0A0P8WQH4_9CLOT|nr:epoxyqueuosine reductase [Oxobacter pfennigii]KPU44798.1 hypothetical protein OXPF_18840 [Oxobacter pfennigii]